MSTQRLLAVNKITVSTDATLADLLTAAGASLNDALAKLVLDPAGATVYVEFGAAATAAKAALPTGGIRFAASQAEAATIHLYAAVATTVYVWQFA